MGLVQTACTGSDACTAWPVSILPAVYRVSGCWHLQQLNVIIGTSLMSGYLRTTDMQFAYAESSSLVLLPDDRKVTNFSVPTSNHRIKACLISS